MSRRNPRRYRYPILPDDDREGMIATRKQYAEKVLPLLDTKRRNSVTWINIIIDIGQVNNQDRWYSINESCGTIMKMTRDYNRIKDLLTRLEDPERTIEEKTRLAHNLEAITDPYDADEEETDDLPGGGF